MSASYLRDLFPEFYSPDAGAIADMWKTGTFMFDTNALMSVIRLSAKARADYLGALEKVQDRLWIPYQVAWELNALLESEDRHIPTRAYEAITKAFAAARAGIEKALEENRQHVDMDVEKLQKRLTRYFAERGREIRASQAAYKSSVESQHLRDVIWRLLEGKIGARFTLAELETLYDEFDRRYERQIPPGYKDVQAKPGVSKYGDVILWYEMLRHASTAKTSVVFITNDGKEDWWRNANGRKSPRHELVREMQEKAGVGFHMYTVVEFMKAATEQLAAHVEATTLAEAVKLAQEEREEYNAEAATQRRGITVSQLQRSLASQPLAASDVLTHSERDAFILGTSSLFDFMRTYDDSVFKSLAALIQVSQVNSMTSTIADLARSFGNSQGVLGDIASAFSTSIDTTSVIASIAQQTHASFDAEIPKTPLEALGDMSQGLPRKASPATNHDEASDEPSGEAPDNEDVADHA